MSGRVGDLSPRQKETLSEFRERIQDILTHLPEKDDHYLLCWLRARNFNIQKSEAMVRKHLEFRRQMKVDTIVEDFKPPEVHVDSCSDGSPLPLTGCTSSTEGRVMLTLPLTLAKTKGPSLFPYLVTLPVCERLSVTAFIWHCVFPYNSNICR
uniref:CRAL/TRIO N-terminal domain-containing protein n=1 Tax=Periophthalmus magnuspinnatus TaxID=409849 RepID=A0A3B4AXA5_9GOBI